VVAEILREDPQARMVRVVARSAEAEGGQQEVTAELGADNTVEMELPEGTPWRLRAEAAGAWGKEELLVARQGSRVALHLGPAGEVTGKISVESNLNPPSSLTLRFQTAPSAKPGLARQESLLCPIQEGRFRCTVPAGRWDLRLRAR